MTEPAPEDAAPAAADAPGGSRGSDEPGRPRAIDEIDPELVRLPRKRATVGPLLAASVLALCAIMMWRLRGDLAFSRQGDAPVALDVPAAAAAAPDDFVELAARPDRVSALHLFASRARDGHRLMPVLGSGGALWLLLDGDPWREPAIPHERTVGRVRRLGDLPFFDALVAEVAARPPAPVAIEVAALRGALEGAAASLIDPAGEQVALAPDTEVAVSETVAGKALVTVSAIEDHPDEMTWQGALVRAGVLPPGTPPVSSAPGSWTFEVPAPAGAAAVAAALVAARLFAARAAPLVVERRARWSALAAAPVGLTVSGAQVPWSSITAVAVAARAAPPRPDARVLVSGEQPADYWYVLPIYALLLAFAALFAFGLYRSLRITSAA